MTSLKKLFIVITFCFFVVPAFACTSIHFKLGNSLVAARNMDWFTSKGFVVINPRAERRVSYDGIHKRPCMAWITKYGSVTFDVGNQHVSGQEGMNEKGLVASVLWLSKTQYPVKDQRPVVPAGYWVQYILDNFKSVNEVIAHMPKIRIVLMRDHKYLIRQHVTLFDVSGNMAVLEYLHGNLVISQGDPLAMPILTNDPYLDSLHYLAQYQGFGGQQALPKGYDSMSRYIKAAYFFKKMNHSIKNSTLIKKAFSFLQYVSQPRYIKLQKNAEPNDDPTQWSVVSDLKHKIIYFKSIHNPRVREIKFNEINFSRHQSIKILKIDKKGSGNVLNQFYAVS